VKTALGGGDPNTIVVDLKNFQGFSMNTNSWTATIGAGTKLGDVTNKLLSAGNRAIAHGTCPDVGIGGHATMGGLGPASRMWGSAMDHVVEVEVVLADGSVVTANPNQNSDVFWAMKGAGSSFGIVTNFKFLTHPAPGEAGKII
jgi:FAD/FMN-containing dehydrogenase